jgi:BlaR1 peptidase M56/von Willebrand factor type A domain
MPVDLLSQLASAAIRASGLGLAAFTGLLLLRIRSSAARHATWTVVLTGMLLQIPLGVVAPTVQLKALPAVPVPLQPRAMNSALMSIQATHTLTPASRVRTERKAHRVSSNEIITGLYLAISTLLFVRMALGWWGLRRILRGASPIDDLGPGVFESALLAAPGSVGWLRARILLPRGWRDWDAVKLRAVLAHERAHIRRWDWLIRVASHVNVCIFWFHPLVWWMERELARLAEEACDDVALSEMDDREDYAATLIEIARAVCAEPRNLNWRVISMASDSNVIRRVNRILNRRVPIPKPLGRLARMTLFACSMPVIYLSAAVKLAPANGDSTITAVASEAASLPLLREQKSPVRLIAQEVPNRPVTPAAPPAPPRLEAPPITMCFVLDSSGSMRDKREAAKAAVLALVKSLRPEDELCIVDFNDDAYLDLDFTNDTRRVEEALAHYDARGGKAMRDAIEMSIEHVEQKGQKDRKVLVLVTEGADTASEVSQARVLREVRNSGVRVYCIGLLSEDAGRAQRARRDLRELAEASGGEDFYPMDLTGVESVSPEIATAIRKQ